jgi:hypothetical protein
MRGEGAPKLIYGCGRSPEGLKFELEIKSKFNWKMKSCKIQRLELISDKIEGRYSKREVVCIHLGYPTKKNGLGWGLPWDSSHGQSWSSMADHGELPEREERGRGRKMGGTAGGPRHGEGEGTRTLLLLRLLSVATCCSWGGRTRGEERKEKREKKKRKEMEIFLNLEIFR